MASETKQRLVQQLAEDIKKHSIVGVVNFSNLPAKQLQNIRATLAKSGVRIIMTRKKLLKMAMENSKVENVRQLAEKIKGMPALILTNDNPFTLYATIQKNKSPAPAKAGQTAPKDITIKAGPTSFAPGPIISELGSAGIKTKVESGKLTIISDTIVAREGDVISLKLAGLLTRLNVQPMEIGLDLIAVLEKGVVFEAKQLFVDNAEYEQKFISAAQWAINLAVESAYLTDDTTELLLQKAFREAKALSIEQDIITDITAGEILAKAERQALSLQGEAKIEVVHSPAEKKETKRETERKTAEKEELEIIAKEKAAKKEIKEEADKSHAAEQKTDKKVEIETKPAERAETEEPLETEEPKEETILKEDTITEKENLREQKEKPESGEAAFQKEEVKEAKIAADSEREINLDKVKHDREQKSDSKGESNIPSVESIIQAMKEKFSESKNFKSKVIEPKITAEKLVDEEIRMAAGRKAREEAGKDKSIKEAERLFEQLKKKGTLR